MGPIGCVPHVLPFLDRFAASFLSHHPTHAHELQSLSPPPLTYPIVCQPPQGSAFKPAPAHSRVRHLTCDKPFALNISQQYSEARSSVAATVATSPFHLVRCLCRISKAINVENQTRTRIRARTHDPISNLDLVATSPRGCNGSHSTGPISIRRALPHLNHRCMGNTGPDWNVTCPVWWIWDTEKLQRQDCRDRKLKRWTWLASSVKTKWLLLSK